MKDNTLRGELMRITKESASTQVGFDEYSRADYPKMIDQLEALLAEEVRKARIDTAKTALIACPTKDNKLREWLEEHIRSLEKEGK